MPNSIFVILIVGACMAYLVIRFFLFKSREKGGCSHGNCGCEVAKKTNLPIKSKDFQS